MKTLLYIDSCIRRDGSRTRRLGEAFLAAIMRRNEYEIQRLCLMEEGLCPLSDSYFDRRQALLDAGQLDHPRFRYAHQFAAADRIVIAAPYWDLTFPALLKIYIENVNLDGITFRCDENGVHGLCRAEKMLFLTTRGGACGGTPQDVGSVYLREFANYVGIHSFLCIAADGMDLGLEPPETILLRAVREAGNAAETF